MDVDDAANMTNVDPNNLNPDCVREALLASLHDAEILLEQLKAMPDSPPTRALIETRALQRERTPSAIVKTRPPNMQIHICQGIIARKSASDSEPQAKSATSTRCSSPNEQRCKN